MKRISVTFEVSKLKRLIDINEKQLKNKKLISITFEVSKLKILIEIKKYILKT